MNKWKIGIISAMVTLLACIGIASASTCVPLDIINNLTVNTSVNMTSIIVSLCDKIISINNSYNTLHDEYNNLNASYTTLIYNLSSNTSTVSIGNCTYIYSNINRTYFDNKMSNQDSSIAGVNAAIGNLQNTYVKISDYSPYVGSAEIKTSSMDAKIDSVNSSVIEMGEKIPNDYNAYFMIGFIVVLIMIAAVAFLK